MLNRIKRLSHYFFLSFFALATGPNVLFASNSDLSNCALSVRSNDPDAKIFVDGTDIGTSPQKISCLERPQVIRLQSGNNQIFTRVMPAAKDFIFSDNDWNVQFQQADLNSSHVQSQQSQVAVRQIQSNGLVDSSQNEQVLTELTNIRKVLEKILSLHPSILNEVANSLSQKPERKINSVTPVAKNPPIKFNPMKSFSAGIFVQLYSLKYDQYDAREIQRESNQIKITDTQAAITFCNWQSPTEKQWLQVLVGPFKSFSAARKVVKAVGRDTFVVNKTTCNPASVELNL